MVHQKRVSFFLLGIAVVLLGLFALYRYFTVEQTAQNKITLIYEDDTVVLKKGDDILDSFSQIEFENLPARDRVRLKNGIDFSSKEEALRQIEDYDG